ncbi:MAG: extracellular solute-binding protein [Clostridia bacterium]|nr:extracellular solute-binding protein [Clostridia bacterium]
MKRTMSLTLALVLALAMFASSAFAEERNTITLMMAGDNTVADTNMVLEELENRLNLDIQVNYISSGDYSTKLNTLIAADTLPDIFNVAGQTALDLRDAGKIIDFSPYLEEYGPDILASYEEGELEKLIINSKGGVYGLNNRAGLSIVNMLIRKDWLANVGLDVPETVDELYEVMNAFTFGDPDGNGENDTYGFVASLAADPTWQHVFSAFGIPYAKTVMLEDGTITSFIKHKDFLDAVEFLRKLYQEGIMDPDFATMTQMESFERFWIGKVGMFNWNSAGAARNWYPGRYTFETPEDPGDLFACVRIIDEDTGLPSGGITPYASQTEYAAVISATCAHPEDAIRFINYVYYTEEGQDLTCLGIEGVMYQWIDKENGLYERIGEYADDVTHRAAGAFVYNGNGGWTVDNTSIRTYNAFAKASQLEEREYQLDYPFIPVTLDAYTEYGTQLREIEKEALANLIVTTGDVEAEYAEYVARWESEGGSEYEAQMTEWWNENR